MDSQCVDGYFTCLAAEIEVGRNRLDDDPRDAYRPPPLRDRRILAGLAALAAVWFGIVTLGLLVGW